MGDVRIGDVNGDDEVDFVIFRSTDKGMKPCYLAAFTLEGAVSWQAGGGGGQPARPGPVALYDFNRDGKDEVLCFYHQARIDAPLNSMKDVELQLRGGESGRIIKRTSPPQLQECRGEGPNWVHQRFLICNLRGQPYPRDFIVKVGSKLLAFNDDLSILWTYEIRWNEYSRCSAYIPSIGDIDNDGRDEVNGGYYILDDDGTPLWEGQIARHMDSVAIVPWDNGIPRAIASGFGHVLSATGEGIVKLGKEKVPHGQEARVADFLADSPGPEMILRYNGHTTNVMTVANSGKILHRFDLNHSPNNTGMEIIYWHGKDSPALLYNGGMLWTGEGKPYAKFPNLPAPTGEAKMGWYHCIPADLCGDKREEALLYNPWDKTIYIYTPAPINPAAYNGYNPTPRQYNARLMD